MRGAEDSLQALQTRVLPLPPYSKDTTLTTINTTNTSFISSGPSTIASSCVAPTVGLPLFFSTHTTHSPSTLTHQQRDVSAMSPPTFSFAGATTTTTMLPTLDETLLPQTAFIPGMVDPFLGRGSENSTPSPYHLHHHHHHHHPHQPHSHNVSSLVSKELRPLAACALPNVLGYDQAGSSSSNDSADLPFHQMDKVRLYFIV
jgi:hypothetical protein